MKKVEILYTLMKDGKPVPVEKMIKTLDVKQKKYKPKIIAKCDPCFGEKVKTFFQKSTKKYLKNCLPNGLLWNRLSPCKTRLR